MKKIEMPLWVDWSMASGQIIIHDELRKTVKEIIDAINQNADEVGELDKVVVANCDDIDRQAEKIAKLEERVDDLSDNEDTFDELLTELTKRVTGIERAMKWNYEQGAPIESSLAVLKDLENLAAKENRPADEPNEPNVSQSGLWICDSCGQDWGDGGKMFRSGAWLHVYDDVGHGCLSTYGGCGEVVTWHPDPPAENTAECDTSEPNPCEPVLQMPTVGHIVGGKYEAEPQEIKLLGEVNKLRAENARLDDELAAARAQVKDFENGESADLFAAKAEIERLKQDLEGHDSMVADKLRDLQAENERLKIMQRIWRDKVDALQKYITNTVAKYNEMSCDKSVLESDLAAAQAKIDRVSDVARMYKHYNMGKTILAALDSEGEKDEDKD